MAPVLGILSNAKCNERVLGNCSRVVVAAAVLAAGKGLGEEMMGGRRMAEPCGSMVL